MLKKISQNSVLTQIILFAITVVSVYVLPKYVGWVVILIIQFYLIKNKMYWQVFFLLLSYINQPLGFFSEQNISSLHRLPIISIMPGASIDFIDMTLLLLIVPHLKIKKKMIYNKGIQFLIFGVLFMLSYSFLLGFNYSKIVPIIRRMMINTLILAVPCFDRNKVSAKDIYYILTFYCIIGLVGQIFKYYTNTNITELLTGISNSQQYNRIHWGGYIRLMENPAFSYYVAILSLYFIFEHNINATFNLLLAALSIVLTGTRGWIISLSFVIAIAFFIKVFTSTAYRKASVRVLLILLVFSFVNLSIFTAFESVGDRLSTVSAITQGDVTAGGTLSRLDTRLSNVVAGFVSSPIIGLGASKEYSKFADGHVGWLNLILQVGLFGQILWLAFLADYFRKNARYKDGKRKNLGLMLNLGMLGLIVVHITSRQTFGYLMYAEGQLFLVVYLLLSDRFMKGDVYESAETVKNT